MINAEWPEFKNKETISPQLRQLILDVHNKLIDMAQNTQDIKTSIEYLMTFLASPEGRTNAICEATDLYFCLHNDFGFGWDHLPEELQFILDDIGGQLHDTFTAPEIALNFDSTPEQLLMRIKQYKS